MTVLAAVAATLVAGPAVANNVVVTNTDLKSPSSGKVKVQFDLAWDNSWRDGTNYDAFHYGGPGDSHTLDQMNQDKSMFLPSGTFFSF